MIGHESLTLKEKLSGKGTVIVNCTQFCYSTSYNLILTLWHSKLSYLLGTKVLFQKLWRTFKYLKDGLCLGMYSKFSSIFKFNKKITML